MLSLVSDRVFVHEQNYTKSFHAIFLKPCRIVDNCYAKNPLNCGVDDRLATILDFSYTILHMDHMQYGCSTRKC